MKDKLTVVKIGGKLLDNKQVLNKFLDNFSKIKEKKILIHGGGIIASEYLNKLGISPKLVEGRRITDKKTLDVVIMTYAGLLNKKIVSILQSYSCNSVGLSGSDCNIILANKREIRKIDYGFVGDIKKINTKIIEDFLRLKITPVLCSLSHDGKGQILNTNADSIASNISFELSKKYDVTLKYCFEKKGVLANQKKSNSIRKNISKSDFNSLKQNKTVYDGMIPKLENCFLALENGVKNVLVGNPDILINEKNCTKLTL